MPDAASVMAETIQEFTQPDAPETSAPAPVPTPAPAAGQPDATQPAPDQPEDSGVNWYEQLLAEQDNDPLKALALDDQAWSGLTANPQQLAEYAANARAYIQQQAQQSQELSQFEQDYEWFGGRANSGLASRLAGDLFRGGAPLTEEEARQFGENGPQTYAEAALERVRGMHEGTAYDLGVAVLNRMPELLKANEDYLLHILGLDPKFKEDYRNVVSSGGYKPAPDSQIVQKFFQESGISPEYIPTLQRLPLQVQQDIMAGDIEAAKFHLERYHKAFESEDQAARQAQIAEQQRNYQIEQQATRALADNTRKIYEEYVEKGKALGLNPLEAAGAAALAYSQLEQSYWEDQSDYRRLMDDWFGKIKGGNKFQIGQGESAYKKAFETAYRKALGQYQPKRPSAPPVNNAPRPTAPPNGAQPQFQPSAPPNEMNNLTGADLMNEILRNYGAIR